MRDHLVRKYELERLLYYYAVVECDSSATAQALYAACDGADFGDSGNVIDLRFLPDDAELPDAPRDAATRVPHNYVPPDFETDVRAHTSVDVRWDETPAHRLRVTMTQHDAAELEEAAFEGLLASASDGDNEEEDGGVRVEGEPERDDRSAAERKERAKQRVRQRYHTLLAGAGDGDGAAAEAGEDMVITFQSGLQEAGEELLRKREQAALEADMTLQEKRALKKAQKKRERKAAIKQLQREGGAAASKMPDEDPSDEEDASAERERRQRNLELLVMDERRKDFHVKKPKAHGRNAAAAAKKEQEEHEAAAVEGFAADERFAGLWSRPEYAIDKTDPHFRASASMDRLLGKIRAKRERERDRARVEEVQPEDDTQRIVKKLKGRK